jgi:hypothetical protein
MHGDEPEAPQTSGRGTCVILCRPGAAGPAVARSVAIAPPRELLSALDRKGLTVSVCASHAEALAELVIHERSLRTGGAQRPIVLLLLEPEQSPGVVELIERVSLYAPRAMIWRYSPAHRPPLTAWAPSVPNGQAASAESVSPAAVRTRPAPTLRLAGTPKPVLGGAGGDEPMEQGLPSDASRGIGGSDEVHGGRSRSPDGPDTPHKPSESPSGPILTQDELSMLLSDDWESHT